MSITHQTYHFVASSSSHFASRRPRGIGPAAWGTGVSAITLLVGCLVLGSRCLYSCPRSRPWGRVPCLGQPVSLQLPAIASLGSGALSRAAGVSTAARAMVLPPGTPKGLRRYERLNLLGEGADAKVFAAWGCRRSWSASRWSKPRTTKPRASSSLSGCCLSMRTSSACSIDFATLGSSTWS